MDSKTKETIEEVEEEVKDGIKEIVDEAREATDWVIQVIVLALCAGSVGVVLSVLLLMLAII